MIQHQDDWSSETAETEWQRHGWEAQTQTLLDSFIGSSAATSFLARAMQPTKRSVCSKRRLSSCPMGTEVDPVLNYGNRTALQLWEMTSEQFVVTPSRLTAELTHREARERLLEATMREGYVDGYEGIPRQPNREPFPDPERDHLEFDPLRGPPIGPSGNLRPLDVSGLDRGRHSWGGFWISMKPNSVMRSGAYVASVGRLSPEQRGRTTLGAAS